MNSLQGVLFLFRHRDTSLKCEIVGPDYERRKSRVLQWTAVYRRGGVRERSGTTRFLFDFVSRR